ncbi:hypothetical protein ACFE04_014189 [Oxalis oulophora]
MPNIEEGVMRKSGVARKRPRNFDEVSGGANQNDGSYFGEASEMGSFQFQLIHRSALNLPKANETKRDRLKQFMEGDNVRKKVIAYRMNRRRETYEIHDKKYAEAPLRSASSLGNGEYFVSVRIGSPPRKYLMFVDTGSDITWVKCEAKCKGCKERSPDQVAVRLFNASLSHSFRVIPCNSEECRVGLEYCFARPDKCEFPSAPCQYDMAAKAFVGGPSRPLWLRGSPWKQFSSKLSPVLAHKQEYMSGASSTGFFANETVSIRDQNRKKIRLHNVTIGCSDWATPNFNNVDGVLGLGYARMTFTHSIATIFGYKFSYCFADHLSQPDLVNYLWFGDSPVAEQLNVKYTQLRFEGGLYGLNITGISVGGVMLNISDEVWKFDPVKQRGGMIIDSGATLTHLVVPAYDAVMAALTPSLAKYKRAYDSNIEKLTFCIESKDYDESVVPKLGIHFHGGLQYRPPVNNYIIDAYDGIRCIGLTREAWPGMSILGNIMQQEHYWEYDVPNERLGFAASACNKID